MLRTVILSPYLKQASGTLEQIADMDSVHLKLNLNYPDCTDDDILRLYAMSTAHAAMAPYLVHSFGKNYANPVETVIYETDIFSIGYKLCEIDTYVITKFCSDGETAVAAAFFGLEWSASRFLKIKQEKAEVDSDSPLTRAKQILDERKNGMQKDESIFFAKEFETNCEKYQKITIRNADSYEWYKINKNIQISSLSAVRHALSNKYALMALDDCGYYVAGINKNDCRHIALAISSNMNICPMPQLADCTNYEDGFHIVGIYLGPDGQYFENVVIQLMGDK